MPRGPLGWAGTRSVVSVKNLVGPTSSIVAYLWYDFIVGDAWEVAVGVGTSLVGMAAVAHSGEAALRRYGWVFLPLIIAVLLSSSIWRVRDRR